MKGIGILGCTPIRIPNHRAHWRTLPLPHPIDQLVSLLLRRAWAMWLLEIHKHGLEMRWRYPGYGRGNGEYVVCNYLDIIHYKYTNVYKYIFVLIYLSLLFLFILYHICLFIFIMCVCIYIYTYCIYVWSCIDMSVYTFTCDI